MTTTTAPVVIALPDAPAARRAAIRAAGTRLGELIRLADDPAATPEARDAARAERDAFLPALRAAMSARPAYTLTWTTATGPRSITTTDTAEIERRGRIIARMEARGRAWDIEVVVDATGVDVTFDFDSFRK